jgi:drug/metabolite transporter (DMT)-like permease
VASWTHHEATSNARHVLVGATVAMAFAWVAAIAWSTYEVVLTRLARSENGWAWPDGFIVGLVTLALFVLLAATAGRLPDGHRRLRATIAWGAISVLPLGAAALSRVAWAVQAPLPEVRAVALPAPTASPEAVVRALVAAWDFHDRATAAALCGANDAPLRGARRLLRARPDH